MKDGKIALKGIPVSPGVAFGDVFVWNPEEVRVDDSLLESHEIPAEESRFHEALQQTEVEIDRIRTRYRSVIGEELIRIFDAQVMILHDPVVKEGVINRIRQDNQRADAAFQAIISEAIVNLSKVENDYLRERVEDLRDVQRRVLRQLNGGSAFPLSRIQHNVILVAEDLTPSETVQIPREHVMGFITSGGGATSHTAIMARSLQIPAVVGVKDLLAKIAEGDRVVLDGGEGTVVVGPSRAYLDTARKRQARYVEFREERRKFTERPSALRDGTTIRLEGNIELPEDVAAALHQRVEGIGLFRTEFLYFREAVFADEDRQSALYKKVLKRVAPEHVVFRTLDVGGDKLMDPAIDSLERNPMLGWRGIRISLGFKKLFRTQLRALLRAASAGNLSILFPMITTMEEVREAKRLVAEAREELRVLGHDVRQDIALGVMIETPAAAYLAPHLAREVDFLSIGTNDLIQYTLAVDRDNRKVASLFDPYHPSVLCMIRDVVKAGKAEGTPVTVCGEMAGESLTALLLVGLGVRTLSLHPYAVPDLKQAFSLYDEQELRELAEKSCSMDSGPAVRSLWEGVHEEREKRAK